MEDENSETVNLDLNLGPTDGPGLYMGLGLGVNLEEWIEGQQADFPRRRRHGVRSRMRHRWRSLLQPHHVPLNTEVMVSEIHGNDTLQNHVSDILQNHGSDILQNNGSDILQNHGSGILQNHGSGILQNHGSDILQTGEGSVSLEERNSEVEKACKNDADVDENEKLRKKEEEEKGLGDSESFFDCNICLDLSSEPVLTCCGHLFCWPCLHQWLNVHSDAKECPVCKGEVTIKNLTPIYGRGIDTQEKDVKAGLKIPDRPQARRVESWRQTIQRNSFAIPMDEMIRRLGSGFDFSRDFVEVQPQSIESLNESSERNSSLLNRILTSRGIRQEPTVTVPAPQDDIIQIDITPNLPGTGTDAELRRLALAVRRTDTQRSLPNAEGGNITQRLIDSYLRYSDIERNLDQPLPVDDRDSMSSIAAAIHSESQTLDTAVEIESRVSLSTSSSRRRNDASRVSDVDSGDSRSLRRRRLN